MRKIWRKIESINRWHDSVIRKLDKYGLGILWVILVGVSLIGLIIIPQTVFHQPWLAIVGGILAGTLLIVRMAYRMRIVI